MAMESKEMAEKNKQSATVLERNTNTNGVVITVYVESVTTRSEDPKRKTKPHPYFRRTRASGTQGYYDRRAQLLAHSRQLRNEGSENVPLPTNQSEKAPFPTNQSRPKTKTKSKVKNMLKELSCKEI